MNEIVSKLNVFADKLFDDDEILVIQTVAYMEQQAKQIDELSAALAVKDEALRIGTLGACTCSTKTPEVSYHAENCIYRILSEALALKPHASILNKIRADAVRDFAVEIERANAELPLPFAHWYAQRIEKGES